MDGIILFCIFLVILLFRNLVYDMDGIILNPALEDYFIPRHVLVDIMEKN